MGKYLIVGGTSGIGKELSELLIQEGHQVTVASRHSENGISGTDHFVWDATTDSFDPGIDGALDGLVYCPGTINLKPFHRLTPADFTDDFNLNVLGAVRSIQAVLPNLKMAESSSIVLFSTIAAQQGMSFHSSVAASKAGLEGLARSLAAELAPKIRVNVVAPSVTQTPLASRLLSTPEKLEASAKRHPLGRVGAPEDIARAAQYLLTDRSSWITGQTLSVDGGMSRVKLL